MNAWDCSFNTSLNKHWFWILSFIKFAFKTDGNYHTKIHPNLKLSLETSYLLGFQYHVVALNHDVSEATQHPSSPTLEKMAARCMAAQRWWWSHMTPIFSNPSKDGASHMAAQTRWQVMYCLYRKIDSCHKVPLRLPMHKLLTVNPVLWVLN